MGDYFRSLQPADSTPRAVCLLPYLTALSLNSVSRRECFCLVFNNHACTLHHPKQGRKFSLKLINVLSTATWVDAFSFYERKKERRKRKKGSLISIPRHSANSNTHPANFYFMPTVRKRLFLGLLKYKQDLFCSF